MRGAELEKLKLWSAPRPPNAPPRQLSWLSLTACPRCFCFASEPRVNLGGGQGTSDPVVYVEAFGQKFATEVIKNRLNAVFDETFVISLRNIDLDAFNEGFFR